MKQESTIVTTSLRLPEKQNRYIQEKAQEIGISQNALLLVLIDLGIKVYDSTTVLDLRPQELT